jgi:hypothetical protein
VRVVLFGAGASFGSEPTARVPPLGTKLFGELVRFAPATWGALPAPWPSYFRADFEPAMAAFINVGGFGAPLQWDMATYFYTQFTATPSSTYVTLFKVLASTIDEYLFATINYELLLFQARACRNSRGETRRVPPARKLVCLLRKCFGIGRGQLLGRDLDGRSSSRLPRSCRLYVRESPKCAPTSDVLLRTE